MKIDLGKTYRDKITGFQGVATGYVQYITGCNQVLLNPPVDEKGAHRDAHWYDEQRMEEVVGMPAIAIDNGTTPGCDIPAPVR